MNLPEKMTKAEQREHYDRELVRLQDANAKQATALADMTRRATTAESDLEAAQEESGDGDRAVLLNELADLFEAVVPVPAMTGAQFETVLEARRLARN